MFSVLMTPISLAVLIGLMVLGALVVGLLGRIPIIGEVGVGLFTFVWILSALLLFFLALVCGVSALLAPAVLATTDEDAFEAVFQSFSIAWSRPWRFLFYEALNVALSLAALAGLGFFFKEAVLIMNRLLSTFMGTDYVNLANNGQAMLQGWLLPAQTLLNRIYGDYSTLFFFRREFVMIPPGELPTSVVIASYLYAFSLLFAAGWAVSYALATFSSGNTLLFLVIKKHKDDENLLERKDAEEESEESSDSGQNVNEQEKKEAPEKKEEPSA